MHLRTALLAPTALCLLAACQPDPTPSAAGPALDRLSNESLTVGETLYFSGTNFLPPEQGKTLVEFSGVYYWEDEDGNLVPEDVPSFTIQPIYDGTFPEGGEVAGMEVGRAEHVLRWNRFGPFAIPFGGGGKKPGIFKGTATAINVDKEGQVTPGQPLDVAIEIKASLLINRLEPVTGVDENGDIITADCGKPALRVFGGMPYVIEVEAIGDFEPAYFIYEIANINNLTEFSRFTHPATGRVDVIGDPALHNDEVVVFNKLSDQEDFAIAAIRITAVDANDRVLRTAYPVNVVRPIGMFSDGERILAEYYEPVPVHGPIVGGIGTTVTYAESQSESRQRAVSVSFTRSTTESVGSATTSNWSEGYGLSNTNTVSETNGTILTDSESSTEAYGTTYTQQEANSVDLSSSTGTDWGWSMVEGTTSEEYQQQLERSYGEVMGSVNTEVGGNASIPGLGGVSGKVGSTVGATNGVGEEGTVGVREGSHTDRGNSMSASENETTSYGSVTTDGRSETVSGTYGVARQNAINNSTSQTAASTESTTFNVGGAESISQGYTVGESEAWSETWVTTSTQQNLLSFTGLVPTGRCAVIYRQTVRYIRKAQVFTHDLCGIRSPMAELTFNEWSWSPNIALGDDCETELPPSTQPKAQCFEACD